MRTNHQSGVFLIALGERHDALSEQLVGLGYRPIRAEDPMKAALLLHRQQHPVRSAIIPAADGLGDRGRTLAYLAEKTDGLSYIALGPKPDSSGIEALRRDGVRLCLWEPYTEQELRYVVNKSLYDRTRGNLRKATRIPANVQVGLQNGAGERKATLYTLSAQGAYIETQRSAIPGGRFTLKLPLPSAELSVSAVVVSTNVPGNLQRKNLPVGMSVRFDELDADTIARLEQFVTRSSTAFEL